MDYHSLMATVRGMTASGYQFQWSNSNSYAVNFLGHVSVLDGSYFSIPQGFSCLKEGNSFVLTLRVLFN